MGRKLQQEIKQTKPFQSLEEEALLNLARTADRMERAIHQVFKPYGLTATQYNALRILRGAGADGLRCSDIGERLIHHDPDITRLMDRLERQKLVRRRRDQNDRRVIYTCITAAGLNRLAELDPVTQKATRSLLKHMRPADVQQLIDLLEETRGGIEDEIVAEPRRVPVRRPRSLRLAAAR